MLKNSLSYWATECAMPRDIVSIDQKIDKPGHEVKI